MYKLPQLPHDQFAAFVCALFEQLLVTTENNDFKKKGAVIQSEFHKLSILTVPLSIEQLPKETLQELQKQTDDLLLQKNNETLIIATNYALELNFQDYLDDLDLDMNCVYLDWQSLSILADNPLSEFDFAKFYPNLNFKELPYNFENTDDEIVYYQKGIIITSRVIGGESNETIRWHILLANVYESQERYIEALNVNKLNVDIFKKITKENLNETMLNAIGITYTSIGALYYKLGDYVTGIEWFEKSLTITKEYYKINKQSNISNHFFFTALLGIVDGSLSVGLLDKALEIFKYAEDVLTKEPIKIHASILGALHLAGVRIYDSLKNEEKAFIHFNELWELFQNYSGIQLAGDNIYSSKKIAQLFPLYYKKLQTQKHLILQTNSTKNSNTALPFSIKQVHIKDFQAIRDLKIENISVDIKWIFITGKNGTGKSSLLQALALSLLGETVEEYNLLSKKQPTVISIELLQDGNNQIQTLKVENKQSEFYKEERLGNIPMPVLTYGVSRLKIQKEEEVYDENTMINLFSVEGGDLSNIEKWLKDKALEGEGDSKQVKMVFSTLSSLMPSVSHIERNKSQIEYTENGEIVTRERLASGNKSILAMIGDILIRLLHFYPKVENTTDFKGIIIIDELDLHLHPSWQRELPWLLSKLFPKIQFICSTHSIIPFMGAPKNSIFFTVDRTEEEGTTIQQLDIEANNLSANILLSSPLFDVSLLSKVAEEEGKSQDYRTESDYQEYDENIKKSAEFKKLQEKYGDILGEKLFKK